MKPTDLYNKSEVMKSWGYHCTAVLSENTSIIPTFQEITDHLLLEATEDVDTATRKYTRRCRKVQTQYQIKTRVSYNNVHKIIKITWYN